MNLSDLGEVTQLGSDEVLEAKTPNRMHSPCISVIISCQVIEIIPLLSHSGDSQWLFTLSSSLCWALKELKMKKAWSLWHRSKGQSQNRNTVMFSILNIFFSHSKHNPFHSVTSNLLFSLLSASSCSPEPQPSKTKALRIFFSFSIFFPFPILT